MQYKLFNDNEILKRYFELLNIYQNKISNELKERIKIIINSQDNENKMILSEQLKDIYSLTEQQLEEYMLIGELEILYHNLVDNMETINGLVSGQESLPAELYDDVAEFGDMRNKFVLCLGKLQKKIANKVISKPETEGDELSKVANFVLLLDNVEKDRETTVNSKSGKGKMAILSVLKEIVSLMNTNYQELRENGKIHQINNDVGGMQITKFNVAYERVGGVTTKVGYVRVPVCKENVQILSKRFKNDNWKYVFLIVGFGDFQNEGISEKELYNQLRRSARSQLRKIERIIELFNTPFNEETLEVACCYIQQGYDNIGILSDDPNKSLVSKNSGKRY